MRIGLLGPAKWWHTGYSVQVFYLSQLLKAQGHEVASFAFTGLHGSPIISDGLLTYPKLFHLTGQDMAMHARHFGADCVIAVMDAWNLDIPKWEEIPVIPWFPVDHEPLGPAIAHRLGQVKRAAVYSQHGLQQCQDAGFTNVSYIPCMVDAETYRPHPKAEARAALGWPQDKFMVGMVAANVSVPSRKAFYQQFKAFSLFHEEHPDSLLYVHTFANAGMEQEGESLLGICKRLGLEVGRSIIFCDQYQYLLGFPPSHLAACYNGMDVLMACAMGEGFCVPLIEAQSCGTPVICGDWTSMGELCFAGWKVPRLKAEVYGREIDDDCVWGQLEGFKVYPRVSAIVECLERAYCSVHCARQEGDTTDLRQQARLSALPFDVRAVAASHWRPFLKAVEEVISG